MKPIKGKGDEQFIHDPGPMTETDRWMVWLMAFGSLGLVALIGCVVTFWSEIGSILPVVLAWRL